METKFDYIQDETGYFELTVGEVEEMIDYYSSGMAGICYEELVDSINALFEQGSIDAENYVQMKSNLF